MSGLREKFKILLKYILLALPYALLLLWLVKPSYFDFLHGIRIETVADMQYQNKMQTQEPVYLADSLIQMQAPDKSFAVNHIRYRFSQFEYDSAESRFLNALPPNDTFLLSRGKNRFETFCVPCHNYDGKGKGLMVTKPVLKDDEEGFPQPADLTGDHTKSLSDARLYHILSSGQNLMFPMNEKLSDADKWCVINYIRHLQK